MRVIDKQTARLRLAELGFLPVNMQRYESAYSKPYGTILVTGPTGSGKSTTLVRHDQYPQRPDQERHNS